MKDEEYKDFEHTNEIWTWVEKAGEFVFEKDRLEYVVAGDTDSAMLKFPPSIHFESPEEMVEIADEIGNMTNESFSSWAKHAFNIPEERTGVLQTDREIVADAAFFVSKKRYVMHVINDEGKPSDKLKIMGLEVKRSDTPSIVQEYLTDLINMILDDKSADEIKEEIVKMKDNYSKVDLKDIARPMSCKGLKIYQDKFEKTGSTKGFPYQVRAAMFYNSLCGPSDKKIKAGEKIGILYIKDPRSKYIAFPSESNTLPEFVYDMVIDYDTQWQKVEKKIISYLKAMGYDFDSQKAAVREELFGF